MDAPQKITHVLNRLSLGVRPGDRAKAEQMGVEKHYIQQQLNPSSLPEPNSLLVRLKALPTLTLSAKQLFEQYAVDNQADANTQQAMRQRQAQIFQEAMQARFLRAIESPRQLQEVMVDFWFNHFNVFENKGLTKLWTSNYEQFAIRPHVLGKFRDLLMATAKHPAMLVYLDNWRNTDPNSPQAKGGFRGLNENYARELMELHTLGINGGYSQADVESLTRILTGWSVITPQQPTADESGFVFVRDRHDPSDKVLLGKKITGGGPDGGLREGEEALALLAQHPATARHISYKLAQYFVADDPPTGLVNQLADRFISTDGDIKAVLSMLFESNAFWHEAHYQRKFKTPYQYLLSIARAIEDTSLTEQDLNRIYGFMNQLGMPLYRCQMPNGYAQVEGPWLNPDAMMRRVSLAIATVNHRPPETKPNPLALQATLGNQLSAETQAIVNEAPMHLRSALMMGSPDMMYR